MMKTSLKDILLIEVEIIDKLETILNSIFFELVLVVFFISLLLVMIRNENVSELGQRLFFSILLVFTFSDVYTSAIDSIFPFCDEIINKFSGRKSILNILASIDGDASRYSQKGLFDKIWGYFKVFGDPDRLIELFFAILCYIVLVLTSLFYTFGYYFGYIFTGLIALIGLFPININALNICIKSLLWSALVPIICASILALLGQELSFNNEAGVFNSALEIIKLFLVSLTLFLSLPMAYAFINGKTAASVISNFSSRIGSGIANTGVGFAGGYVLMAQKGAFNLVKSPASNLKKSFREFSNTRAGIIQGQYNLTPDTNRTSLNPLSNLKQNINSSIKEGKPLYSSIMNPQNISKSITDTKIALKNSPSLNVIRSEFKNNSPLKAGINSIENISVLKSSKVLKSRDQKNLIPPNINNKPRRNINGRNKGNFPQINKRNKSN